jgi:hypothetical protein
VSQKQRDELEREDSAQATGTRPPPAADVPLAATLPPQARMLLAMQQGAGNRAVSAMVQRMRAGTPGGQANAGRRLARAELQGEVDETPQRPAAELDEDAEAELDETEGEEATEQVPRSPLARMPGEKAPSSRMLQRHSITSGMFTKKVKFKLNTLSATLTPGLEVQPGASLNVGSKPYRVTGTVTATGPAAEVAKYELGFVQTMFRCSRRFSYERQAHQPGIPESVLPSIFGTGAKTTTAQGILPSKDGDTYVAGHDKGEKLYYEKDETKTFANAAQDTQTTTLYDRPNAPRSWDMQHKGHQVFLVKSRGLDTFRTWLVIRKRSWGSTEYRRLGYIDWHVNYKSDVTPNYGNPSAGAVQPGNGSGGTITATVKGVGVYLPVTGADAANDLFTTKVTNRQG